MLFLEFHQLLISVNCCILSRVKLQLIFLQSYCNTGFKDRGERRSTLLARCTRRRAFETSVAAHYEIIRMEL